jgi:putative membrane protein
MLKLLAQIAVLVIAIEHVYILVLEMFLWNKPAGLKAFGQSQQMADATKVLAANQGLYNGFLAAGLFWGLATGNREFMLFFLVCVLVAGLYGGLTSARKILFIQALPAAVALALVLAAL